MVCGIARNLALLDMSVYTVVPRSEQSEALLAWCNDQGVAAEAHEAVLDASAPHSIRSAYSLWSLIRQIDPSVVNLHYGDNFVSLWDILAARLSKPSRKVVASIHHPTPWASTSRRKRAMTALGCRLADAITTFSRATEDILVQTPISRSRIERIPCGIAVPPNLIERTDARRELGLDEDTFVVGCVARLVSHKGVDILIDAMDTEALHESTLVIVGDGPIRGELEQRAASVPHLDVRFLGRVKSVDDVLAACDVFALPSRLEGFGLVYVEAAMHGVPSVGTKVGGIPDAVIDGVTGLLVDVDDVDAFRRALVALATDPTFRRELGTAARERAITELDDHTMAVRFAGLFRRLTGGGHDHPAAPRAAEVA